VKVWSTWVVCILLLQRENAQEKSADLSLPICTPSVVKLTPERLDFGTQAVGISGRPRTVILTNTTNSTIRIRDILASGIDFAETDSCKGSLPPGANCTIEVTFTPAVTGPRLGTLIITDSDPASPHYLVLAGVGTNPITSNLTCNSPSAMTLSPHL
jgi:hypothetical protein